MLIIAFESSCDETSVAIAAFEAAGAGHTYRLLSCKTATQIETHALYGGVVPEIAGRAHAEAIAGLTHAAFEEAGVSPSDLDAVAVTNGPGLIGALLVGLSYAKAFAFAHGLPLVPVNHILGHIAAAYYEYPTLHAPFYALVASGGHTSLIRMKSPVEAETLGRTRDDAMGEAFDKAARVLGIPYPGGAALDRLACEGDPTAFRFPSAALPDGLDFSFSGLKTAVINAVHTAAQRGEPLSAPDVAASLTATVVRSAVTTLEKAYAAAPFSALVLAGGVAANSHLRRGVRAFADAHGVSLCLPSPAFCSDNAAMIAAQGYYEFLAGHTAPLSLNAYPTARGKT